MVAQPLSRVRHVSWRVLAWGGAALYPVVVYAGLPNGLLDVEFLAVVVLTVLVLTLLRRNPLPAFAVLLLTWTAPLAVMPNLAIGGLQLVFTDLAVGRIAAGYPRRVSITVAVIAGLVQAAAALVFLTRLYIPDVSLFITIVLALAVSWMVGNSVRVRRLHARALHEQAIAEERLRIARELHDMVAHSIGIIAIQAGVGGRVIETQPAEARNALAAIEATSRDTLSGLRRMVTALRKDDPGKAPLGPMPGLDDLDRLAEATNDAGVRVDVRIEGEPRPLPPDIDLSAYRIVQEAVTNVVRHADIDHCQVTVDYRDQELLLEVADDGHGGVVGTGYGIVGMRERAGLLGGEFTAGPRPGGGFRVAARIPLARR